MQTKRILHTQIINESYDAVLEKILALAHQRQSSYICACNVHMTIESWRDKQFAEIVNAADLVLPDGRPVAIAMNLLYGTQQVHFPGPDMMIDIITLAEQKDLSIFFYGSTPEVLDALREKLAQKHPQLKIAGMVSPPFRPLTQIEDEKMVHQINASDTHLVMVALGCPKQEKWMFEHRGKINAVMLGVGAAFPFYTGQLKRAPRWMQQAALEWFFRLIMEPRRLFVRYLITNNLFLALIGMQWFRKCLLGQKSA